MRSIKCTICDSEFDTPVCVLCMTDRVESWLENRKVSLLKEFRQEARKLMEGLRKRQRMTCSFCRINTDYSLCSTCFSKYVLNWLAQKDAPLATQFMKYYELDKSLLN